MKAPNGNDATGRKDLMYWFLCLISVAIFTAPLGYLLTAHSNKELKSVDSKPIEEFAFAGSCLSLFTISFIILLVLISRYFSDGSSGSIGISISSIKRHPSSLTMCVALCSIPSSLLVVVYHLVLVYNGSSDNGDNGTKSMFVNKLVAFIMQLTMMAREMWVASLSLDLFNSITNPFASYKINLIKYHTCIWTVSITSAVLLVFSDKCSGQFLIDGVWWVKVDKFNGINTDPNHSEEDSYVCLWSFYFSWVAAYYLISVLVLAFAYRKLSCGLNETFATRFACVSVTFRIVTIYCLCFGAVIVMLLVVLLHRHTWERIVWLRHVFAYLIACRGCFDGLIWIFSYGIYQPHYLWRSKSKSNSIFHKSSQSLLGNISTILGLAVDADYINSNREYLLHSEDGSKDGDDDDYNDHSSARKTLMKSQQKEADLSPQLNFSLRAELLFLVSQGIRDSVMRNIVSLTASSPHSHLANAVSDPSVSTSASSRQTVHQQQTSCTHNPIVAVTGTSTAVSTRRDDLLVESAPSVDAPPPSSASSSIARDTRVPPVDHKHNTATPAHTTNTVPADPCIENITSATFAPDTGRQSLNSSYSLSPGMNDSFVSAASALNGGLSLGHAMRDTLFSLMGIAYLPGEYGTDRTALNFEESNSYIPSTTSHGTTTTKNSDFTTRHTVGSYHDQRQSHYDIRGSLSNVNTHQNQPRFGNRFHIVDHTHTHAQPPLTTSYNDLFDGPSSHEREDYQQPSSDSGCGSGSMHAGTQRSSSDDDGSRHHHRHLNYSPAEVVFYLDKTHKFRDFKPATFLIMRQLSGISEERYLHLTSLPTKERLHEGGGSGAFLFFCGDGELIVKSVLRSEALTLLSVLDKYLKHINKHRDTSMLVRYLGLHSITMYGNEFYFVVMKNVMPAGVKMNEKYDIKGSWIGRDSNYSAQQSKKAGAICRHCNEYFYYDSSGPYRGSVGGNNSSNNCSAVVGPHEEMVTLKDSNLTQKLRLQPEHAYQVIEALLQDSDALCDMGLMDYSLLVGVKTSHYDVIAPTTAPPPTPLSSATTPTPGSTLADYSDANCTGDGAHTVGGSDKLFGIAACVRRTDSLCMTDMPTETGDWTTMGHFFGRDAEEDSLINDGNSKHDGVEQNIERKEREKPEGNKPRLVGDPPVTFGDVSYEEDSYLDNSQRTARDHLLSGSYTIPEPMFQTEGFPARSVVAPSAYFMGVIDVLQTWTVAKRIERFIKVYIHGNSGDGVSCCPPEQYKLRFQQKVSAIIEHSIFVREVTGSWKDGNRVVGEPKPLFQAS